MNTYNVTTPDYNKCAYFSGSDIKVKFCPLKGYSIYCNSAQIQNWFEISEF